MYIVRDSAGFDYGNLRQGDILEGVPFPLIDLATLQLFGTIPKDANYNSSPAVQAAKHQRNNDTEWMTGVLPIRFGFCVVLSSCCDLEPRKGKIAAPVFTLARLHPIPQAVRDDRRRFESLCANKDPRNPDDPGYIDFFYMEPHALLGGADWRVHFNQVSTLPTDAVETIFLRKKILQLDDRTRMKFKIKLGFTLMRMNDEERELGLENPWQEPTQAVPEAAALPAGEQQPPLPDTPNPRV